MLGLPSYQLGCSLVFLQKTGVTDPISVQLKIPRHLLTAGNGRKTLWGHGHRCGSHVLVGGPTLMHMWEALNGSNGLIIKRRKHEDEKQT